MAKFCGQCGAPIEEGKPFCIGCGAPTGEVPAQVSDPEATVYIDNSQQAAPAPQQEYAPAPQQEYVPAPQSPNGFEGAYQAPAYAAPEKKSKKGLIIGLIAGGVALVATFVLLWIFVFSGGGADDLVGIWKCDSKGEAWEFTEDGKLNTYMKKSGLYGEYTYEVDGDEIVFENNGEKGRMEFSLNGDKLLVSFGGREIEMEKVDSLGEYSGSNYGSSDYGDPDDYDDYGDYYDDYDDYGDYYDDYYDYDDYVAPEGSYDYYYEKFEDIFEDALEDQENGF